MIILDKIGRESEFLELIGTVHFREEAPFIFAFFHVNQNAFASGVALNTFLMGCVERDLETKRSPESCESRFR